MKKLRDHDDGDHTIKEPGLVIHFSFFHSFIHLLIHPLILSINIYQTCTFTTPWEYV